MERVTAAVVTYNGSRLIDELACCLHGLPGVRAVVYDSGSTDDTLEMVERKIPEATLLRGSNLGFGHGCNKCVEVTNTEYTLLLNSDASISEGSLMKLVSFLDADRDHAAVQPLIRLAGWEHVTASRGVYVNRNGRAWDAGFMHLEPEADERLETVPCITAAVALWRTDVLRRLGGFDTGYFMYFEDADLSLRAGARGHRLAVDKSARAFHRIGSSSTRLTASLWELESSARLYSRFMGGGRVHPRWILRELRSLPGMIRRGLNPFSFLSSLHRCSRLSVIPVSLPQQVLSSLQGDPWDLPQRRFDPGSSGACALAAPWTGITIGEEKDIRLELLSTGNTVTGQVIHGNGSLRKRFTVPADGRVEVRLAASFGQLYIKCDNPQEKIRIL